MENPALDTSGSTALATATEPTRAADAIVDMLVAHGVEVIFGLPGGPISPLLDALLDRPEIQVINTRSEGAAMFAAAGYAHASGKLGVAAVTVRPPAFAVRRHDDLNHDDRRLRWCSTTAAEPQQQQADDNQGLGHAPVQSLSTILSYAAS